MGRLTQARPTVVGDSWWCSTTEESSCAALGNAQFKKCPPHARGDHPLRDANGLPIFRIRPTHVGIIGMARKLAGIRPPASR